MFSNNRDLYDDFRYDSVGSTVLSVPGVHCLPVCVIYARPHIPLHYRLSVGYPGSLLELCLCGESLCMGFVGHM